MGEKMDYVFVRGPDTGELELRHRDCTGRLAIVFGRALEKYRPPEDEDPVCNGCEEPINLKLAQLGRELGGSPILGPANK